MENWKILDLGLLKLEYEVNDKYTYSPPPQLGASDPLSRLTAGLCVYLFYPDLFPSEINIISPPQKKHPDCPLNGRQGFDRAVIDSNKNNNNKTSVLLVVNSDMSMKRND